MKKITLLIAFIGMITLQSCTVNEDQDPIDNDTIAEVFEYSNVNLTSGNGYSQILNFPYEIYSSDMVLVYRLVGVGIDGDVWKLLPETYYFSDGTLNFGYESNFTQYDAQVNLFGFDLPGLNSANKINQVFRVVVVPGYFANKSSIQLDFKNYEAVEQSYELEKVIKIKL